LCRIDPGELHGRSRAYCQCRPAGPLATGLSELLVLSDTVTKTPGHRTPGGTLENGSRYGGSWITEARSASSTISSGGGGHGGHGVPAKVSIHLSK